MEELKKENPFSEFSETAGILLSRKETINIKLQHSSFT